MDMAAWTHNTNVNRMGYDPMLLVTGKSVIFPRISSADVATESMYDNKAIKNIVERHAMMMRKFRETEYSMKLKKVSEVQNRKFNK